MRAVDRLLERLTGRRVKWEPILAMVLLLLLGLYLVTGPTSVDVQDGAIGVPFRIGTERGKVEVLPQSGGGHRFRVLYRNGETLGPMGDRAFAERFGESMHASVLANRDNWIFRLLNITHWGSLVWVAVGLGAQLAFFGRMLIQWVVSEKKRDSVVPEAFWWLSLLGGVGLFAYFVWRQDPVGVLGQSTGVVIYARNLRLIHKQRRRTQRRAPAHAHSDAPA
ncbi:MAG: lipid-A-disaccharide synthase N-terminal domain-containing protein [Planctomycetota bacterium]